MYLNVQVHILIDCFTSTAVDTSARSTGGDIRLEVRPNKFTLNHNNNNNNNLTNAYGKSSVSRAHQQPRST